MFVYVVATLDTKGHEAEFVCARLRTLGVGVKLVDAGCIGDPAVEADISADEVFCAAGLSLAAARKQGDRGRAVTLAAQGVASIVHAAYDCGELLGVLGLGGSAGTTIGTAAMRVLPLGVPKVMVSTLASGQVRPWVGDKDICMLNSIVDIAGINRISRQVLGEAAAAMAGMVKFRLEANSDDKPLVVASMFGVTTPCVQQARAILEAAGYEVLVFHATGNGGQAMESLIAEGAVAGVLDITTTELADELVGGILSAGPSRLTAAARRGVPQVVSVGALDMVNFGPRDTVPERFADRKFHVHNATVTLMRTIVAENEQLGREIGQKLSASQGPTAIVLPKRGVSALDRAGQPFDDPQARAALFDSIRSSCGSVEVIDVDVHINDSAFARAAAEKLLEFIARNSSTKKALERGASTAAK